ncbi:MAG: hypothetical protein JRF50_13435 [Deltaproteobacteria bacterium]|nr:hypothetical protein [Deltaproteobacteria bacterium]
MRKSKNGQSGMCLRHISPLRIALPTFAIGYGAVNPAFPSSVAAYCGGRAHKATAGRVPDSSSCGHFRP